MLKENKLLLCLHINRSCNEAADELAKKGSQMGWDYIGYTYGIPNVSVLEFEGF